MGAIVEMKTLNCRKKIHWFYIFLYKRKGKITVIKKCERDNTIVYLVNYLLLPNMVAIHYLQISGQILICF